MRILILFAVLIFIIGCEKNKQPLSTDDKYFDPANINLLELENINGFWDNDTIKSTSDYMGAAFNDHEGFLKGIDYRENIKGIGISVFKTQSMATDAMELRINSVACVIQKGTSDEINDKWWFSDCIPNIVLVNKWNTIIEVNYYHNNYEEIETILINTAIKIAERVDNLSK